LHVVTFVAQNLREQLAYADLVIDHQYLRHFPESPSPHSAPLPAARC
jgi:hypothetical protein